MCRYREWGDECVKYEIAKPQRLQAAAEDSGFRNAKLSPALPPPLVSSSRFSLVITSTIQTKVTKPPRVSCCNSISVAVSLVSLLIS